MPYLKKLSWLLALLGATVLFLTARAAQVVPSSIVFAAGEPDEALAADLTRLILQDTGASQTANEIGILIVSLPAAGERAEQLAHAVQDACSQAGADAMQCSVASVAVDEPDPLAKLAGLAWYPSGVSGVFVVGSLPQLTLSSSENSVLSEILEQARGQSAVIVAVGAAAELFTAPSFYSLKPLESPADYLQFGAVAMSPAPAASLQNLLVDPVLFQPGRLFRMLNALSLPGAPGIGIGLPGGAAVKFDTSNAGNPSGQATAILGANPVMVMDVKTYHAAETARYTQPGFMLSLRNVLVHVLSPGSAALDLETGRLSSETEFHALLRNFDELALPVESGEIIIAGDALFHLPPGSPGVSSTNGEAVLTHLVNLAGGAESRLLLLAAGFSSPEATESALNDYTQRLDLFSDVQIETHILPTSPEMVAAMQADAILLLVGDPASVDLESLPDLQSAWLNGAPLLLNPAAASLLGGSFQVSQDASPAGLPLSQTGRLPGSSLLPFNIIPGAINQNQWGALFGAAYSEPGKLAIGVGDSGVVELSSAGAVVTGADPLLILDLRSAALGRPNLEAAFIHGGLLDVFAPGEAIRPLAADPNDAPFREPTPILPSATPTIMPAPPTATLTVTPEPTASPTLTLPPTTTPRGWRPTRTPRPTEPPPEIPPPPEEGRINLLVFMSILIVGIVLLGIRWNLPRR